MHRWLYITFLLLLAGAMQSPRAWTHRHETLSPQELAMHLRLFHAGAAATEIPQSWHVHRTAPQLGDLEFEQRFEEAASLGADLFCNRLAQQAEIFYASPRYGDQHVDRAPGSATQLPLFRVYQSLLI